MTNPKSNTEVVGDWRHDALIDFRALSGVVTDDDGIRKMSVDELATMLSTSRNTLYEWQKKIPDFWDKVNQRRTELAPNFRLAKMHEVWYLAALSPKNFQDRQLWLANFDKNFRMPTEKIEHSAGTGFADMVAAKRQAQAIEGEVVDADQINNT